MIFVIIAISILLILLLISLFIIKHIVNEKVSAGQREYDKYKNNWLAKTFAKQRLYNGKMQLEKGYKILEFIKLIKLFIITISIIFLITIFLIVIF